MSVLFNGAVSGSSTMDTGDIGHSLRFRSAASAYLSRTPGSGSQTKWVLSFWVKRGLLSYSGAAGFTSLFGWRHSVAGQNGGLSYNGAADKLQVSEGATTYRVCNSVCRDPTSYEHVYLVWDSNNATQSLRCQIWRNGVLQTYSTELAISSGATLNANTAVIHTLGADFPTTGVRDFFDGYISRTAFIDNPSSTDVNQFGYLNTEINEWVSKSQSAVKAVVDAGGTNSFMLDFDNGTSLTTLGYDKSSKGNNWTLNSFSLTAGSTYDWMIDVPGNSFTTLNAINKGSSVTLSEGNLSYYQASASHISQPSTMAASSGKWYFEAAITATGGTYPVIGIARSSYQVAAQYLGQDANSWGYGGDGTKRNNAVVPAYGATYTTGDVIGVALDLTAGNLEFFKNGVSQGVAYTGLSGEFQFALSGLGTPAVTINTLFGQAPLHASATYDSASGGYFRYTPPSGYKALCQRNMPDPAILNPEKHFDVVTRVGTAATYSVTGIGFPPDLLWSKSRGRAVDHALYDSVRGVQKQLESNQTGAETTESTGLTAFNSDGYTGGALDQINGTTATNSFVDWLWKAGGAAVTNNAGSISSQVSANVTAGFSIVTYTGTGANATVGHGLGKVPSLVIHFNRNVAYDHPVWHKASLGTEFVNLNTTAAKATDATLWNSAIPTSTVINLGTSARTNYNQQVAYCFADIEGYSKIGSYTGNGSADGPYVHCGFKPKYVLVKSSTAADDWRVYDAARPGYNVIGGDLRANSSVAEATAAEIDFTSNGFKLRVATTPNAAQTYVYYAVADVAGKYSLGR